MCMKRIKINTYRNLKPIGLEMSLAVYFVSKTNTVKLTILYRNDLKVVKIRSVFEKFRRDRFRCFRTKSRHFDCGRNSHPVTIFTSKSSRIAYIICKSIHTKIALRTTLRNILYSCSLPCTPPLYASSANIIYYQQIQGLFC